MYRVTGDGISIYNDLHLAESVRGLSPTLKLSDNTAGSFEITLPPGNAGYESLKRLFSEIIVYRDNTEIWSGRIISERKDFLNQRILTCEGELAYLNDTTQPPREYEYISVLNFLTEILNVHNTKVSVSKRFIVGTVSITGASDSGNIYSITNDESTLDVIFSQLVEPLGGHLRVRKVGSQRYLDYLKDWPTSNPQEIRFGDNLLDFTRNWDVTGLCTVVMPRGAKLDESPIESIEAYTSVESVNGGSRYVTNEDAIAKYGWIESVITWDDVEDPQTLLGFALEYLRVQQFDDMIIELTAVDLRYLGRTAQSINLLDQVRVVSRPHGLDRSFEVSELTIQFDKPDASTYTLGGKVSSGSMTSAIITGNREILNKIEKRPSAQSVLTQARDQATLILNMATRGYVTIVKNELGSESIVISSDTTYDPTTDRWSPKTRLWRWNINGLGYSSDGGRTYGDVAIDMFGRIVANSITTGTMAADRIRGGILESNNGNLYFNMDAGSFQMTNGSIELGGTPISRNFSVNSQGFLRSVHGFIGGFNIEAGAIRNDALSLQNDGLHFWRQQVHVGSFGTNAVLSYGIGPNILSMDLDSPGNAIIWAYKANSADTVFTVKMMYLARSSTSEFSNDTLHSFADWDFHNFTLKNVSIDGGRTGTVTVMVSGGGTQTLSFVDGILV